MNKHLRFQTTRRVAPFLVLVLGALASGCGSEPDHGLTLYPVTGRVRVDGQPEEGVVVKLHPRDKLNDIDAPRPFGTTDEDGAFELGTISEADGAPAGTYVVTVTWPEGPTGPGRPRDRLGWQYARPEDSSIVVEIDAETEALEPIDVERPETAPQPPSDEPEPPVAPPGF